jgi:Kef-type K+ transport system membrane component KefB
MTAHFFIALLAFIAIPAVIGKLFGINKVFPVVFLQLLLGCAIHLSGMDTWLAVRGMDLNNGPLADSLYGMGLLGVSLLIALTAADSAPREPSRLALRFIPVSMIGFVVTCTLGTLIGYALNLSYPELGGPKGNVWIFSFAIGICLSVTALPVLIAILEETGLSGTVIGRLATNCALLDDVWLWLGLATLLSFVAVGDHPLKIIAFLALYLVGMFVVMRPLLRRFFDSARRISASDTMLICLCVIFVSSIITDLIGLHSILGAFVAGAVLPAKALQEWREQFIRFNQLLLLPLFFILTGLRLQIDVYDPLFWQLTGIVTLAAVLGKFVSVALAGRYIGLHWHQSFALGSLMQCKGLMELVAINILLDAGVIGPQMFSALAMMALLSTFVTAPALGFFLADGKLREAELPEISR